MPAPSDAWYVLLPNGRVFRASTTVALRSQLGAGEIPFESRVRRSADEEWVSLEWSQEFADLVTQATQRKAAALTHPSAEEPAAGAHGPGPAGVASRLDPARLHMVGVRGLVGELLAALDSTLVRGKLVTAALAGILGAIIAAFGINFVVYLQRPFLVVGSAAAILGLIVVAAVCNTLLTQMTYIELSRLRPARWAEARAGVVIFSLRLVVAYIITIGGPLLAIGLLRWLTVGWNGFHPPVWPAALHVLGAETLNAAGLVLELVLWPMLVFALLLGPLVVIEECPILRALAQWWRLLRQQFGRVFLYETLAAVLAGLATLPFCVPLVLAAWNRIRAAQPDNVLGISLFVLGGLAAAPLLAYLAVANVFIFLNLQYQQAPQRKSNRR